MYIYYLRPWRFFQKLEQLHLARPSYLSGMKNFTRWGGCTCSLMSPGSINQQGWIIPPAIDAKKIGQNLP